jgi:hypothetical protein
VHDHLRKCARKDEVEGREGQRGGRHKKQQIDRVFVECNRRSSVAAAHTPSEAILADPRGNCEPGDYGKSCKLL